MAADLSDDVLELKALLGQATRLHVQSLISTEIQTLEKVAALSAQSQGKATLIRTSKAVPEVRYTAISSFSWDQDIEKVKVHATALVSDVNHDVVILLHAGFPSLKLHHHNLPIKDGLLECSLLVENNFCVITGFGGAFKEKVAVDYKARSFELKVHDVDGKNHRLGVPCLLKAIVPEKCSVVVKPTRITIILKKQDKGTWSDLHTKEDKLKPSSDSGKEPMSGLMRLMKNMYDDGDDEMKRNIANAYAEAREGKSPGMRNL